MSARFRATFLAALVLTVVGAVMTPLSALGSRGGGPSSSAPGRWTDVTSGLAPTPRQAFALAYDAQSDRVILFGAFPQGPGRDDTWAYDLNTNAWTDRNPGFHPSGRWGDRMAYDSRADRVILFGGYAGALSDETWAYDYDNNSWTDLNPVVRPPALEASTLAYDAQSDRVILFGGARGPLSDETWAYDYGANRWANMSLAAGPAARWSHAMAYDPRSDRVLLFGGQVNGGAYSNDTWTYDYDTNTWTDRAPLLRPSGRADPGLAYDAASDSFVLFGGGEPASGATSNETWTYDYDSNLWTLVLDGLAPSARYDLGLAYDSESERIILFGGAESPMGGEQADTWSYEVPPDYVPANPSPTTPLTVGVSLPVSLSIEVENLGGRAQAASVLRFYNGSAPATPFATFSVPPLGPSGTSARFTANWESPAIPGAYTITAEVDAMDDLTEWNESNDLFSWTIQVVPGPITTLLIGTPNYAATYVTSSTPLTFFALDQSGIGILRTEYRIDAGPWLDYTAAFQLAAQGERVIEWFSEDYAGNVEIVQGRTVIVDNTPPMTTLTLGTPSYQGTFATSATPISLSATDGGGPPVGVSAIEYRIDGGPWRTYAGPLSLPAEGVHAIEYRGSDLLGNTEGTLVSSITVDDTAPTTALSMSAPSYQGVFVTSATAFTFSGTDGGIVPSGVAAIKYRIDGGPWLPYANPFIVGGEGAHDVRYRGSDHLGNTEETEIALLLVDDAAPTSSMGLVGPSIAVAQTFVTSATRIILTASDAGVIETGVATVEYSVDGATWIPYASPLTMRGADGPRILRFRGEDRLGNLEAEKTAVLVLDNTAPKTAIEHGPSPYTPNTLFALAATDGGSGLAKSEYRIDGGAWTVYGGGFTVPVGTHLIEYRSVDALDNVEPGQILVLSVSIEIQGTNWNPVVASLFAFILAVAGVVSSRRRPWKDRTGQLRVAPAFAFDSLPFVLAEVAVGLASIPANALSIPPLVGPGMALDITIFAIGLSVAVVRDRYGRE